jgi:micrococcal nuclease
MFKKTIATFAAIAYAAVILLSACAGSTVIGHAAPEADTGYAYGQPILYGPYIVGRVFDGDTIFVLTDDTGVRVRLIGIDTPESVHRDGGKNTEYGKIASEYTCNLLEGKEVYLEYDADIYDDYDRTLAYVYLDDKTTMVNRLLLQNGHAVTMTITPNTKYADEFYKLQSAARDAGVGLWA